MTPPAFVLGLSATGLAAVRSLARRGVQVTGISAHADDPGRVSRYCASLVCPDPAGSPRRFADFLLAEAARHAANPVLIPTEDAFVTAIAALRPALEPHFGLNLPAEANVPNMLDKRCQYRIAAALGIPVPRTFSPANPAELAAVEPGLRYPVFAKPVFTYEWRRHFSGKGFEIGNADELRAVFEQIFRAGVASVLQEVIPGSVGDLYSVCLYAARGTGEILAEFGMRKLRQSPPDYGVGTLVESVSIPELSAAARKFCAACGYTGVAEIEFKRDPRDGVFKLIELNPRLWTQNGLAAFCGVDFAYLQYADVAGLRPDPPAAPRTGCRWLALFEDLYVCRHYLHLSPAAWLKSIKGVNAFAHFAYDDPRPFLNVARIQAGRKWRAARRAQKL